MKADKLILVLLAAIAVVKFVAAFPLDNSSIPGGTDVAHFLTNTWYVATQGITKWNYFWYGGFPFLRYYPPLAFLMTGAVAKAVGVLFAYKLVNDLFVALAPFAFYLFLREFKLSREKEIIALLTFSFIPVTAYFLADGRFPTLINLFFALLYWKFLKRSLDSKKILNSSLLAAALFLGLSFLTHHTTTFLFIVISSAWALIYKTRIESVKKLSAIGVLTMLLTAWWLVPFLSETLTVEKTGLYLRVVGDVYVSGLLFRIRTSVLESAFYASQVEPLMLIALAAFVGVISLLALTRYKDKNIRDSIILLIFILIMIFVVRYQRSIIFASVPFAFVAAEGLGVIRKNVRIFAYISFLIVLTSSYLLIRPQVFEVPPYPEIPKDGRVIFFPIGAAYKENENNIKNYYEVILSPMKGQENIFGWHDESQLVGPSASRKAGFLANVSSPINMTKADYNKLLKAAYINYVVVNKNDTVLLDYFKNPMFKKIFSDGAFVAYETVPKSTYVESDGKPVESKVAKPPDRIEVETNCKRGEMTVKESYHKMWHASINGRRTDVTFNEYGFIRLSSDFEGPCKIVLEFKDPNYYMIFYIVSAIALAAVLFNMLKNF